MALSGPIVVNNSVTSSDTQASGLGPATAAFASDGTWTNGLNQLTTGDALTGVEVGHCLFVNKPGNRCFYEITNVGAGTIDVTPAFDTDGDGTAEWAVGGVRDALFWSDSQLISDLLPGWTAELGSGHDETLGSGSLISIPAGDPLVGRTTIRGEADAAIRPVLRRTIGNLFNAGGWVELSNIDFEHQSGGGYTVSVGTDCIIHGIRVWLHESFDNTSTIFSGTQGTVFDTCSVYFSGTSGSNRRAFQGGQTGVIIRNCMAYQATIGCRQSNNNHIITVLDCIFVDCVVGVALGGNGRSKIFDGCIFDNCGTAFEIAGGSSFALYTKNNIYTRNDLVFGTSTYTAAARDVFIDEDHSAFWQNTAISDVAPPYVPGPNSIGDIGADPFVDASIYDYTLNTLSPGGEDLRKAGYPARSPTFLIP